MTMLGRMVCLLILVTVVTAMPSNMDAYFCHVPTATISDLFAKSLATVDSEFASLLNAVSCTRAYDIFIADFASKCRNFPEIWDVVLEEYELRTEKAVKDIALATNHKECGTIKLMADPAWVAKWKKSDIKAVVMNLRKKEPEHQELAPVSDLSSEELTEFTTVARACIARALESHLKKGPLKNIVKALLEQDLPIDAIAHLNGTVHLARNSDTLMDAQFKYKNCKWQSELCTRSFFNMFDAALEDYRSEQRHGNKMSIREHWQQLMFVWRCAKEWRFDNVISRYQEKFNGETDPEDQEWHKFVSEIVRKATEFDPNTVGRVYPPLTAHQPAQGEDAAPSPPVSMPTRGVLPPSLGGPQPSAYPSAAPAPAPRRSRDPPTADDKAKAYRTIARCWIKFLNRAGQVEVCGKEHTSILDCSHLKNRVKGDGSKYYKDGESFGNNTNAKAAFMLASGAVLPDGTLPPETDALLRQMFYMKLL